MMDFLVGLGWLTKVVDGNSRVGSGAKSQDRGERRESGHGVSDQGDSRKLREKDRYKDTAQQCQMREG